MSDEALVCLEHALDLAAQMLDAAAGGDWPRVIELEARQKNLLREAQPALADPRHHATLDALQQQHRMLMQRVATARESIERQIDQHQYSHRALHTYITSSR